MLEKKIKEKKAEICVIGLGYVGLPLALKFTEKGFRVKGIEQNITKINKLKLGESYVDDVSTDYLKEHIDKGLLIPTNSYENIDEADIIIICVPTPLNNNYEPDVSAIVDVISNIIPRVKKDTLIILESTTYPGATDELIVKPLTNNGFNVGEEINVCFSPERIDPGNNTFNLRNTPKIVGGSSERCYKLGELTYKSIALEVHKVESTKAAEMAKLLENSFRLINIAFINEFSDLCESLGVNAWEIIEAADTKPFGFMRFNPGPGIGGHCIPLDPLYLTWKARESNFFSKFIPMAFEYSKKRPGQVVKKVGEAVNSHGISIRGSRMLLMGMSYKPDIGDSRESPSLEVFSELKNQGAKVDCYDPYFNNLMINGQEIEVKNELDYNSLKNYDCVILLTNHSCFDYQEILYNSNLIVSCNGQFNQHNSKNIYTLGRPMPNFGEQLALV